MADCQVVKTCIRCKTEKQETLFKKRGKLHRGICLECHRVDSNIYKKSNSEKVKAGYKIYYENNKEKEYARTRKWQIENKEHCAQRQKKHLDTNPELKRKIYDKTLAWKKLNRDKNTALQNKRRAMQMKACPAWLNSAHHAEIEGYYLYCSIFPSFVVDHIFPLQGKNVCGLHVPWNLQPLTFSENSSKGNRMPPEDMVSEYREIWSQSA